MTKAKLSEHFTVREFACPCCGACHIYPTLLQSLEALRTVVSARLAKDTPLRINSGYRCTLHNSQLPNSSPFSMHCIGKAADIRAIKSLSVTELAELAETIPAFNNGGIGLYGWGIHVDVRGYRARWYTQP